MHWSDRFVIIHAGAMGRVNGLDRVVRCAEQLKESPDILFLFLGDGSERPVLEKMVTERNLSNVQFISTATKSELLGILPAADIGLVSVSAFDHMMDNCANKFFDYLACGLPVLLNYGGWKKEVLDKYSAGLGCDRFEEDQFIDNIRRLRSDRQLRKEMGINARVLAEQKFSRDLLALQVLDFLACCEKISKKD
jgi:glycosyltransferase involved in cell wall biosynthesis